MSSQVDFSGFADQGGFAVEFSYSDRGRRVDVIRRKEIVMVRMVKLIGIFCLSLVASATMQAQEWPRYAPSRPTVSPYLNLTNQNRGVLPNYYSLVRPMQNQVAFDNRIAAVAQAQARNIRSLQQLTAPITTQGTGTASVYQNYSHYYPMLSSRPGFAR